MTFSQQILAGLAAGVLVGVFFGDGTTILSPVADGFVKLLQMTVLPYVTISIVSSLGSLEYREARALGLRVGAVIGGLWIVALVFAFLIPLAFPTFANAAFFSTSLVEPRPPFDFVDLYIPANPFYSLANNVVPAVVLFSIVLGVALIGVEHKKTVLDVLFVLREAVSRATGFVTRLTPIGLFAIAAIAAGTLNPEQLGRLQIYLVMYVLVSLLLSLWVLPGLVGALTPIPARELLRTTSTPLMTAFVAGDLFIVLPLLIDDSKRLLLKHGVLPDKARLPEAIVPASFNFPHTGKLLSISFVLFAGWFSDANVSPSEYPRLAASGVVTFFGSLNVAVPFLLDAFRIPADTFQLFLATGIINSRFGTLLAAVHTITVALLGTCAVSGAIAWQPRRMVRYVTATAVIAAVMLAGGRTLFGTVLAPKYTKDQVLAGMNLLRNAGDVTVRQLAPDDATAIATGSTLDAIAKRGALRVGFLQDSLPYAFVNQRGDLVGFDIELAHRLAAELRVDLELVPVARDAIAAFVNEGRCDIVMSGVAVTTTRATGMLFSASYLDETLGLLVADHDRERFGSWRTIAATGGLTIGVPGATSFGDQMRHLAPNATLRSFATADEVFTAPLGAFDAVLLPAERGSAWTLLHPQFSMVVPEGSLIKVPLAYPLARHDAQWATFINTWIDLKRKDGTLRELTQYWIQGQDAAPARPRWSIVRDVLHWTS